MMRFILFFAAIGPLVAIAGGCRRERPTSEAVEDASPHAPAPLASAAPAPASSDEPVVANDEPSAASREPSAMATPPTDPTPPEPRYVPVPAAERVVLAWNDALDKHAADRLAPLYADRVLYYGRSMTKAEVIAAKTKALASSTYRQQLVTAVATMISADHSVRATFIKRSGLEGRLTDVDAALRLRGGHGTPYVIVEETDAITEGDAPTPACEAIASRTVNALPQVKRLVAQAMADADDAGAGFGGIEAMPDDDKSFTAGMGLHSDGRYEEIVGWHVDSNGEITVTLSDDQELAVPPAAARAVARVCKH